MNPKDFNVGDHVRVCETDVHRKKYKNLTGFVVENPCPLNGCVRVRIDDNDIDFNPDWLKLVASCDFLTPTDQFCKITEEMARTYEAKNADYGDCYTDGFNRFGPIQLVSRIYEKFCRVEHLLCHNSDAKVMDESVIDTLTDLANQAIILRMLIEYNDLENVK